ncbi:MAG TPA: hypothetical protein VKZ68_06290 [Ohtaekwangia sp.]|nr:hypothetical protein [Ohtaekwangia sp.]
MTSIHQRHRILESLDGMDEAQMESVLRYIKRVVGKPATRESYEDRQKREAMRQIREALNNKQERDF